MLYRVVSVLRSISEIAATIAAIRMAAVRFKSMRDINTTRSLLSAWCSLLRLPNLLTIPGDPLAGAILASTAIGISIQWTATLFCILVSLCLYSAGLLANDFFDRHQDARERPSRPIPSGTINPRLVLGVSALLTAGAIGFATRTNWPTVGLALLLAFTSWSYNLGGKRLPVIGPILMGMCRTLSLLLGAAAMAPVTILSPTVLIPAAVLGLLIASITGIARRETETVRLPFWQVSLPPAILLFGLSTILLNSSPFPIPHSPSPINHSPLTIPHSPSPINH